MSSFVGALTLEWERAELRRRGQGIMNDCGAPPCLISRTDNMAVCWWTTSHRLAVGDLYCMNRSNASEARSTQLHVAVLRRRARIPGQPRYPQTRVLVEVE